MQRFIARLISILFHPLLIPSIGFLLLFKATGYLSYIPLEMKRLVLLITFLTTCLLPLLSIGMLTSFTKNFDVAMSTSRERIVPLLITGAYYYMGYFLLGRLPITGLFRLYLLGAVVVILAVLVISFYWKISIHLLAVGALLGGVLALSFRFALNPVLLIVYLLVIAGLVGYSRIFLEKHKPAQVYAGFVLGWFVMYFVVFFI